MTGRDIGTGGAGPPEIELSGHELDLLADYLGGALDGTPAHAQVARRIQDDPLWRTAHVSLAAASATVAADLAAWGATPEPMPTDVTERIAAELRRPVASDDAGAHDHAGTADPEPSTTGPSQPSRGGLSAVPGGRADDRPRRRVPRWAAGLAAAATVLAFCGFGLQVLPEFSTGQGDTATSDAGPEVFSQEDGGQGVAPGAPGNPGGPGGAAEQAVAPALASLPIGRLAATGTAYQGEDLPAAGRRAALRADAYNEQQGSDLTRAPGAATTLPTAKVAPELRRLVEPAGLRACLTAIGTSHPQPATAIDLVDYATFEGSPALIVFFTDAVGTRWAWVAGPRCGLPGAGPDTRLTVTVG